MQEPVVVFSEAEAARTLRITLPAVRCLARSGRLHPVAVTVSGWRLYTAAEVERWRRERTTKKVRTNDHLR